MAGYASEVSVVLHVIGVALVFLGHADGVIVLVVMLGVMIRLQVF
jgi:hypothetical protein